MRGLYYFLGGLSPPKPPPIYAYVHALEDISHDPNPESSCKAELYLNSLTKIDFLVALEVTVTCFAYTLQLSISLQSKQQDISKALSDVMVIRSALEELREGADEHFKQIFKDVSDIANLANVEIFMPRICGRQTQRININSKDPETYFKVSVFLPFLDFILQELDAQFNQRLSDIIPLQGLIPSNFSMYDDETILKAASIYAQDLSTDDNSILKAELRIWRHQWKNKQIKTDSAIDTLPHCTTVVPNIKILLLMSLACGTVGGVVDGELKPENQISRIEDALPAIKMENLEFGESSSKLSIKKEICTDDEESAGSSANNSFEDETCINYNTFNSDDRQQPTNTDERHTGEMWLSNFGTLENTVNSRQ